MNKLKFNKRFRNQTDIGKLFGLSAIKVGKILQHHGLKDKTLATTKAIAEGYAVSTPLKDGTQFFLWNVEKLKTILSIEYRQLSEEEFWIEHVKSIVLEANKLYDAVDGMSQKLANLMMDTMYDDVPQHIVLAVRNVIDVWIDTIG